uniref:NTR domain-containing protein n=1 Tax=Strongyloides venezuelensis TaxID=75913 RepID=A0A0K0EUJ6_STRVS
MRIASIFYLVAVLFSWLNPTTQWAQFTYVSRDRIGIRGQFNKSVAACQYTICKSIFSVMDIRNPGPDACNRIMKVYSGIGKYNNRYFRYLEVYSIVKTYYKHYQFIGDCACSDPECTHFQAFCVYTYWLGFKQIWNHPIRRHCLINGAWSFAKGKNLCRRTPNEALHRAKNLMELQSLYLMQEDLLEKWNMVQRQQIGLRN